MLGLSLVFVGIVLVHNGILFMSNVKKKVVGEDGKEVETLVPLAVHSPKSIAFFNVIVGALLVIGNFIMLGIGGGGTGYFGWQNITAGMLFGVTYLFIAANFLFKLDMRPFGIYSLGVTLTAAAMIIYNIIGLADTGLADGGYHSLILAILWALWLVLWLTGFLQFVCGVKKIGKIFPWLSIILGVISAFVPGILLIMGVWPLL